MGDRVGRERVEHECLEAEIVHLQGLIDDAAEQIVKLHYHSRSLVALVQDAWKRKRLARLRKQREDREG